MAKKQTLEIETKNEIGENIKDLFDFIGEIEKEFNQLPLISFNKTIEIKNQDIAKKINTFKREITTGKGLEKIKFFIERIEERIVENGLKEAIKNNPILKSINQEEKRKNYTEKEIIEKDSLKEEIKEKGLDRTIRNSIFMDKLEEEIAKKGLDRIVQENPMLKSILELTENGKLLSGLKVTNKLYNEISKNISKIGIKIVLEENEIVKKVSKINEDSEMIININNVDFKINISQKEDKNKEYIVKTLKENLKSFFEEINGKEITKEEKQFIETIIDSKSVNKPNMKALDLDKATFELFNTKSEELYKKLIKFIEKTTNSSFELQEQLEYLEKESNLTTKLKAEYSTGHGGIIFDKRTTTSILKKGEEPVLRGFHQKEDNVEKIKKIQELMSSEDAKVSKLELHAIKSGGNNPIDLDNVVNVLEQFNQMNFNIEQKFNFKIVPLGQHKADGLYIDNFDIVAVNGKSPGSILHEIIHLIDIKNIQTNPLLMNKREEIIQFGKSKLDLSEINIKKIEYYSDDYEIIARMGEIAGLLMEEENEKNNYEGTKIIATNENDISMVKEREYYEKNKGIYFDFQNWTEGQKKEVIDFYKSFFTLSKKETLKEAKKLSTIDRDKIKKENSTKLGETNIFEDYIVSDRLKTKLKNISNDLEYLLSSLIVNKKDFKIIEINREKKLVTYREYIIELIRQILSNEKTTITPEEHNHLKHLNYVNQKINIAKMFAYATPKDIEVILEKNKAEGQMDINDLIEFLIENFTMVGDNLYLKFKKEPMKSGNIINKRQSLTMPEIKQNIKKRSDMIFIIINFIKENYSENYEDLMKKLKQEVEVVFTEAYYQNWSGGGYKTSSSYKEEYKDQTNTFEIVEKLMNNEEIYKEIENRIEEEKNNNKENKKTIFIIPSTYEELKEFYKEEFINKEEMTSEIDKKIIKKKIKKQYL